MNRNRFTTNRTEPNRGHPGDSVLQTAFVACLTFVLTSVSKKNECVICHPLSKMQLQIDLEHFFIFVCLNFSDFWVLPGLSGLPGPYLTRWGRIGLHLNRCWGGYDPSVHTKQNLMQVLERT